MRKAAFGLGLLGLALASTTASARYGVGDYYSFTSAYVGALTQGSGQTINVQPTFPGNPSRIGFGAFTPSLSGSELSLPVPTGRHSARWWRVFTSFQVQQVYTVLSNAGVIGGKGGAGVPGPVAGAGLPFLAAFGAFAWLRRRRQGDASPALAA